MKNTTEITGTEETLNTETQEVRLQDKTMAENFDAGFKIMGLGMAAVFGVLLILYVVIKILGNFAKGNENEKN